MKFLERLANDADSKYSKMLAGETESPVNYIEIDDPSKYEKKKKELYKRLENELDQLKQALATIKNNKAKRLDLEVQERLRKHREEQERLRRIEQEKERKRARIETPLQLLALISPIVLSIIFAIILFSNKEQISIIGNFAGWCTGWVFFTIASLIVSMILLKKRFGDWDYDDNSSRISAVVIAVFAIFFSIIGFTNSAKLSSDFDPTTFVSFEVTGKTTQTKWSSYYTTISFSGKNNSDITVDSVKGEMSFYNGNSFINTWTVTFNGPFKSGHSYNITVDFDEYSPNLYNVSYEQLGVTYKITSMWFNGDYTEHSVSGTTTTLKRAVTNNDSSNNNSSGNNSTRQNPDKFQEVSNYKLESPNELLEWLHHDVSSNIIIPDQGLEYISYSNNGNTYSADYSKSYIGSTVLFHISNAYADTIVSSFKQKLNNNGWVGIYDDGYSYEYVKGNTHIVFHNVKDSGGVVWNGYEYEIQYYYMNFSAFTE